MEESMICLDPSISFILIKPDALNNKEIYTDLFKEISNKKLNILEEKNVHINEKQIECLWPYTKTDSICKHLIRRYLCKDTSRLLLVSSDGDSILKTTSIKTKIRDLYAKSPFMNCIHTPSSMEELKKDYDVLFGDKKSLASSENKTIVIPSARLDNLTCEQEERCAICLEKMMMLTSFKEYYSALNVMGERYILNLVDDDVHDAKYTASIILECFEDISIEHAYYIAFGTNYLSEFVLHATNNSKKATKVISMFANHGMKVRDRNDL
jgi:nucleoside diphosphate kinase